MLIRRFRGLRPVPELAPDVASPPYDVLGREEARAMAEGNPRSFLRVIRPEIELDGSVDPRDPRVYRKARENLDGLVGAGTLRRDPGAMFYAYRQRAGEHRQTGLVALTSIDAYEENRVRRHELTRPDKEDDRVRHMEALDAQTGPVFLAYRSRPDIDGLMERAASGPPEYDFADERGTRHAFWPVRDAELAGRIDAAFNALDRLYVADGHHRSAAAARVRESRRRRNPGHRGDESYNFFLSVLFPHDQVRILDYNRVLRLPDGMSPDEALAGLEKDFEVEDAAGAADAKPDGPGRFALYLDRRWRRLRLRVPAAAGSGPADAAARLDISVLQERALGPLFGIRDQRTDDRVDFVGGVHGLGELERRVGSGRRHAAVAVWPVSMESLMAVADAGGIMPPKSTWFEPKLRSGLAVHVLD